LRRRISRQICSPSPCLRLCMRSIGRPSKDGELTRSTCFSLLFSCYIFSACSELPRSEQQSYELTATQTSLSLIFTFNLNLLFPFCRSMRGHGEMQAMYGSTPVHGSQQPFILCATPANHCRHLLLVKRECEFIHICVTD
jgi:hypothetical protein